MRRPEPLETSLEKAFGRPLRLVWTENRSVYLSLRPPRGAPCWTLRLHGSFREAPEPVWEAVRAFLRTRRRAHLGPLREHFTRHARSGEGRPRRVVLRPRGRHHDLRPLLAAAAAHPLFGALPPVAVTWGTRRQAGVRCVRLGSYRAGAGSAAAVVRIHPVLDAPAVPALVISSVLHHELVHHLLTCRQGPEAGRRHGAEFRHLDRLFPQHGDAERWLACELAARLG